MAVAFAEVHRNAVISLTERLHKVCHLSWAVSGVVGASARALRREKHCAERGVPHRQPHQERPSGVMHGSARGQHERTGMSPWIETNSPSEKRTACGFTAT